MSLKTLILLAYKIEESQLLDAPGGIASERYDVVAKSPADAKPPDAKKEDTWVMLQTPLSERFKLAFHREDRQLTTYALVVSKNGLKLRESQEGPGEADDRVKFGAGLMTGVKGIDGEPGSSTFQPAGHRVVDRTGIGGKYNLKLNWTPSLNADLAGDAGAPSERARAIPEPDAALEDQLGLKLVPEKGPVQVLVVDR